MWCRHKPPLTPSCVLMDNTSVDFSVADTNFSKAITSACFLGRVFILVMFLVYQARALPRILRWERDCLLVALSHSAWVYMYVCTIPLHAGNNNIVLNGAM